MSGRPIELVGVVLLVAGLLLYAATAVIAMARVKRHYSSAMRGTVGFAFSAGIAAAIRHWWMTIPIIVGIVLIAVGRMQ